MAGSPAVVLVVDTRAHASLCTAVTAPHPRIIIIVIVVDESDFAAGVAAAVVRVAPTLLTHPAFDPAIGAKIINESQA